MNEHWEDDTDRGKRKLLKKTLSPCHLVHHDSQVGWHDTENRLRAETDIHPSESRHRQH
jgi:hypothetical protein